MKARETKRAVIKFESNFLANKTLDKPKACYCWSGAKLNIDAFINLIELFAFLEKQ